MNILTVTMGLFICLELMNVTMLYFNPGSKLGNGIGVFNAWEKSKQDNEVHQLVKYLVYWVAGTKLIFIGLLIAIIIVGSYTTQLVSAGILVLSILSFFWRLYPIIREMDDKDQITPKGYSKTLGIMIAVFVSGFVVAFLVAFF